MFEERLLISGEGEENIEDILDNGGWDYDWDSGERLMVKSEDMDEIINILEEAGYDVDIV
jgi:hypothetical protein